MSNATRKMFFSLVCCAFIFACVGCSAQTAQKGSQPTTAKTKAQLRQERQARAAELKAKREAAAKTKREAAAKAKQEAAAKTRREAAAKAQARREQKAREAAELKAKREAAAKAKREAEVKAKAKREERARLAKLDAEARKQASVEIAQADREKKAKLAELETKFKKQNERLMAETKAEQAKVNKKFEQDKAKLKAEYEQAKAQAKKNKARLEAEYKQYQQVVARLEAEHKKAMAVIKEKSDTQNARVKQARLDNKAKLARLDAEAKKQAKDIKAEEAALKRKYNQDKAALATEYKRAKALAKKDKTKLVAAERLNKQKVARLEAQYKEDLTKLKEKSDAQASQIKQTKAAVKEELEQLETNAKQQAKDIAAEIKNLDAELKQDKKGQEKNFGLAKLAADYMKKVAQVEEEYAEALEKIKDKTDARTAEYTAQKKQIEDEYKEKVAKVNLKLRLRMETERVAQLKLPEDNTARMNVREVKISGNKLISTANLLENLPSIYNSSDKSIQEAQSKDLFDLRDIQNVIIQPGEPREVSMRTIQGFTQYLLSVYQENGQAGIYVYVPSNAIRDGQLQNGILPVNILEASISTASTTFYTPENKEVKEGYLSSSVVSKWSPVKIGEPPDQKKLDDFVNLLNENPDRYVSAVVSRGTEPNSLAVGYNIYEANPWHWFIQADNSGTRERQWNPRIGVVNTNLLGFDDTFTAMYQAPWDATIDENYGLYGSYDIPILGPWLRLNLYGGYSEFDINPESGILNFLGRGSFYGGLLRYNLLQQDGWFFDITGSMEYVESRVVPSLFPTFLGNEIEFWMWGAGIDLRRSDDISQTSILLNRFESLGGGSKGSEFRLARVNADSDFTIYNISASHSQYMDTSRVERISGTFRWTGSDERLVPAKMTTFGGMYSVRGYDEYEFVADGGILASAQYEFDLIKYEESKNAGNNEAQQEQQDKQPFLRKLAPLAFVDYGRAKIRHPAGIEKDNEDFFSVGIGTLLELGDNFSGAVYYGYPLKHTDLTRTGKGRVNVGMMLRW